MKKKLEKNIGSQTDKSMYSKFKLSNISYLYKRAASREQIVFKDLLTGLGNRYELIDKINSVLGCGVNSNTKIVLLLIDLGCIQSVNYLMGHRWCDLLIKKQSVKLKKILKNGDLLVRSGVDEFAILVAGCNDDDSIKIISDKIIDKLKHPISIESNTINLRPSIGIACFPNDANDTDSLLTNAHIALNQSKESGRNSVHFFNVDMHLSDCKLIKIEQALSLAIENDELSLVFQPKVQLSDSKVVGAEALLRWSNAELGDVSPSIFIPLAEKSNLIIEIGEWVVIEACKIMNRWKNMGVNINRIAINVSVQQLESKGFSSWLFNIISFYSLSVEDFELEVTETSLINDEDLILEVLRDLSGMGFRIVLDDFGTGYSSLYYLKNLPLSTIKIDQSFIYDMNNDNATLSIVKTIIQLAKDLNLNLVAEGVEEDIQASKLLTLGCEYAQGYLFYKPLPSNELEKLILVSC